MFGIPTAEAVAVDAWRVATECSLYASERFELQVVGKLKDAEFFIFCGRSFFETGYSSFGGIFGGVFGNVTTKNTAEVGEYYVLMRRDKLESGRYRPRILWGQQNLRVIRGNAFIKTKLPAKDVTERFVKELQKARTETSARAK